MTEKELRKLNRTELLELLILQSKEMGKLQLQLKDAQLEIEDLQEKLDDKHLQLQKVGSIAEAAISVNGVFEAAQKAADQYLDSVKDMTKRQKEYCNYMRQRTLEKCKEQEDRTEEYCKALVLETRQQLSDYKAQIVEGKAIDPKKLEEIICDK